MNKTTQQKITFPTKWPPQTSPTAERPHSEGEGGQVEQVLGAYIHLT